MLYFAYGSNMSRARLRQRAPSARFVDIGTLSGYQLAFHKVSARDGSGKCDAKHTGSPEDRVVGVVFDVTPDDKSVLDGVEAGYDSKEVEVAAPDGRALTVQTYVMRSGHADPARKPYHWYKKHVLAGARENRLPQDYIAMIESVEAERDPDQARRERELAIYR